MANKPRQQLAAQNRRATFDYFIDDRLECGIMLAGSEVKSLRGGQASINEAYAGADKGELYLFNAFIPEYLQANRFNHATKRPRKLLVRKRELNRLLGAVKRDGVTLVPISIYFNERGRAKVEIGVARGKKAHDKRATERDREWARDKARVMRRETD
ncbi:MAG TPA: SsrA-binding protein SmpB [Alphaproteobacteria bacterium]|nr:SsrA-binding protein SmpB [Alphaproteobacteria bacterium]